MCIKMKYMFYRSDDITVFSGADEIVSECCWELLKICWDVLLGDMEIQKTSRKNQFSFLETEKKQISNFGNWFGGNGKGSCARI